VVEMRKSFGLTEFKMNIQNLTPHPSQSVVPPVSHTLNHPGCSADTNEVPTADPLAPIENYLLFHQRCSTDALVSTPKREPSTGAPLVC